MLDRWKERRKIKAQIKDVESRIQRTAKHVKAETMGYAVATSRWEIDRLNASLRRLDAEPWLETAKRHFITIPEQDEYWDSWQVDAAMTETVLSDEGKHFVKTALREKRFRFVQRWGSIIAILISLIALAKSFWK